MFEKVTLHIEGFPALATVVSLATVVRLHVGSQVGSVRELLPTMSTAVRFLSCVRPHVSLQ